jgi:transposase-like protein
MQEDGIFMSKREQVIYCVIEDYRIGKLSRSEAAMKLNVSEKTIQRKAKKVRLQGITGMKHGNLGKRPRNQYPDDFRARVLDIYRNKYWDFNFKHALEMMLRFDKIKVSYSTFRTWCREKGLGKVRRRKTSKPRIYRERSHTEGFMLQMDGCHDPWNGRDKWCLISMIDDATSNIVFAEIFHSETTWACLMALKSVIQTKGVPEFILTDRAGWASRGNKRIHFSQFVRACEELDIRVISTSNPESKGRVERSYRTIQDRLKPELRFHNITSMTDVNRYIQQVFLPEWERKFTVIPRSPINRFKAISPRVNLDRIICLKYKRQVNRDHTVHFEGDRFKIKNPTRNLWKSEVMVHKDITGKIEISYDHQILEIEKIVLPTRKWVRNAN